ncbi:hypothetical protein [Streptomyces sp. TE33382]
MPIAGIVHVLRPELADTVLVAAAVTATMLGRSRVRYQRLRRTGG